MKLRLFGCVNDSIVDGPGLRYSIFVQGCYHNCLGCHNPESHDVNGGYLKDIEEILKEIDENPLSGGEPMLQVEALIELSKEIKKRNLNIVLYSGYTYEQIINDVNKKRLLELCDMLVDGKFELEKRSLSLLYRGSSNQRLINVQESLKQNRIIEYDESEI